MTTAIIYFYSHIDVFLVICARFIGFFYNIPIFGGQSVPNTVKIGTALLMASIFVTASAVPPLVYGTAFELFVLVLKELLVGIMIGQAVYIILSAAYLAGHMFDMEIGLSMVSVYDPLSQTQVPISGNILYFMMTAVMVATNLHHVFIRALYISYDMLPIGTANFFQNEYLTQAFFDIFVNVYYIGLQMAMPIVGGVLLLNVGMGLLTKAAPQMHIFAVGMSVKILIGLYIFYMTMPILSEVSLNLMQKCQEAIWVVIRSLAQ